MSEARVQTAAEMVRHYREMVRVSEKELAERIREALREDIQVTAVAKAAGLSRERIYQIRDGRR